MGTGGAGGAMASVPSVTSTIPLSGAIGVAPDGKPSATFSEAMDCASLNANTFLLTTHGIQVPGTVTCANSKAVFGPSANLANSSAFAATITTGAKSLAGIALAANYTWNFTTGVFVPPILPVNLGSAGNYVVLAKSGISTVPTSAITGNLGLSPAAASFITGFSLTADGTNVFSTSPQVTGKIYAANDAAPTPASLTAVVSDMMIAFTDAAGRAPSVTELGAGDIGGMTLTAGVYKWGTGLLIPTDVTLHGSATDVFIFQIAQDLVMSDAKHVTLTGGALPKNVFWQVAGLVDIGTTAHFEGIILTKTAITLHTGASANGRLLAQTAVELDSNAVVQPAP